MVKIHIPEGGTYSGSIRSVSDRDKGKKVIKISLRRLSTQDNLYIELDSEEVKWLSSLLTETKK